MFTPKILVIDDEPLMRVSITDTLKGKGYLVRSTGDGAQGIQMLQQDTYDIVITDLRLPKCDGLEVLREAKRISPELSVILITAYATVESAVEAMKQGAYDYLTKPFLMDELLIMINRLTRERELIWENQRLRQEISRSYSLEDLVGKSPPMQKLFDMIDILAKSDTTVLIQGETGTGKELVARAIHQRSLRRDHPLIKVNCAALPESLLETELFGHERGAFTGAIRDKKGKFELAEGGSIFFDDIDDLPLALQGKLLRILQEREFERVGGTDTIRVNVRVISATKQDLRAKVDKGEFRDDLFYRLNVVCLVLPPLRDRREDIPLLVQHFLARYNARMGKQIKQISPEGLSILLGYPYPGNVRELENIIERAMVLCPPDQDTIPAQYLAPQPQYTNSDTYPLTKKEGFISLNDALKEYEKGYIMQVLQACKGQKGRAAERLGISRKSLWEKLKAFGLD
jgi:DNA-binding NtrC family response regulator